MKVLVWMGTHWVVCLVLGVVIFLVLAGSAILEFLVLAGSAILEAYLEVKQRPKKPMLWCSECKSYFTEENAIQLFPELGDKIGNTKVCASCYFKKVFIDPEKKLV
jgi:hypothetical protein